RAAARMDGVVAVVTGRDDAVARIRIRARSALPGYVETEQPVLAWPIVRHAGEALAAVVAADRYTAEDAAARVVVDYAPLPAVVDVIDGAPRVNDAMAGNLFLTRRFD